MAYPRLGPGQLGLPAVPAGGPWAAGQGLDRRGVSHLSLGYGDPSEAILVVSGRPTTWTPPAGRGGLRWAGESRPRPHQQIASIPQPSTNKQPKQIANTPLLVQVSELSAICWL